VPALFAPGDDDIVVRVRYPRSVAPLLGDYLDRADVRADGDDDIAAIRLPDENALRRTAARRGGVVEILDPPEARAAAASWAEAGLAQYR
jgi:proteasome accessory factor C